ncbi:MAG TPA: tetratricopeptide repeat protein [Ohtaekwangia sp.]
MTRLEQLQKFYAEDSGDPFNVYALALELSKSDSGKALTLYEEALRLHPDYLPTYYHAAKLCELLARKEQAIQIYKSGIDTAKRQQQFKTLRELQSALDELIYE